MATTVIRKPASFRLRADLLEGLKRNAARENRTLNNYVESVLLGIVFDEPNEETKAAIKEAKSGKNPNKVYDSVDELFKDLDAEKWKNYNQQPNSRKIIRESKNNPNKVKDLQEILEMLKNEQPIPAEYKPHLLHGEYKGCLECHIQNDFLLIWIDDVNDIIELVRLGSHSELFKKY